MRRPCIHVYAAGHQESEKTMIHYRPILALLIALSMSLPTGLQAQSLVSHGLPTRTAFAAQEASTPRYDLQIDIDPASRRMSGHMQLTFTNRFGVTLPDAVLRLYPNFPADLFGDGGDVAMDVTNIRVDGIAVAPTVEARGTALRIALPHAAEPGATIKIEADWSASFRSWKRTDNTVPLPSYYPTLAAWTGSWRTDVTRFPDRVFAGAAVYRATIRVPAGYTVIASGSTTSSDTNDGRTTFTIETGTIREFAFSIGRFAAAHANHDGIAVNVYHQAGDGLDNAAQQIALHAAASLAVYNNRFGRYPYAELDFHLINARRGYDTGVEYPGLIYILINGHYTQDTRYVVAHETAHQWWYGIVGNDVYREPWLDEGFAQWSPLLVESFWAGPAAADRYYRSQILNPAQRTNAPAGLPTEAYGSWSGYYHGAYGRGALFLQTLRRELGDDTFFTGLRRYYNANKYGVASTEDFRSAMENASGRNLHALFKQWTGHS